MQSRSTDTKKTSQNHTSAPQSNFLQTRPFGIDTPKKSATPTTNIDFDAQYEHAKSHALNLAHIPVMPASTANIQTKSSTDNTIQTQTATNPTHQHIQGQIPGISIAKPLNIPSFQELQNRPHIGQQNIQTRPLVTPNWAVKPSQLNISANSSIQRLINNEEKPTTRQRSSAFSAKVTGAGKKYSSDFSDFDSKQFRVSGRAPNRRIEEVKRQQMEDGKVVYYAMGLVTGFNDKAPMIAPYPEPIALGDWYPQVTHINGMAVAPKSGILSAEALQESVNQALDGQNDMALGQDAVDVLYTYSAQRGGVISDVFDCIKGKVQVRDAATEKQEEIILDAVHRQKRVTVSAHSRGTIKTDNAVRNAHKILTDEYLPAIRQNRYQEIVDYWTANDPGIGLDPKDLAELSFTGFAANEAKTQMNKFIQLIYAGNAVQHPSEFIDISIYVGGLDPVSMFVGTYSEIGRKIDAAIGTGGSKKSKLHSVGKTKGHGFVDNYIPAVSQEIANDLKKR